MDSPITLYDEVLLLLVSTSLICNNGIDDLPPVIGPPFKFVFLLLVCQESITPESIVLGKKYDSIYADKFCVITLYTIDAEQHQKEIRRKTKMKKYLVGVTALVLVLALVTGCNGVPTSIQSTVTPTLPSGMGMLKVYVTDAPGDIEECYVTIKSLEVHKTGGPWTTIYEAVEGQEPVYKLIELGAENISALLTSEVVASGEYTQLRLDILKVEIEVEVEVEGDVEAEYENYDAKVPSGEIKLVGPFEVKEFGETKITLDFDVEKSVHKIGAKDEGKTSYIFKPVIKLLVIEALEITTTELPNGSVEVEYNEPLEAIDGTPPYTWSIPAGLPPELPLTLDAATGAIFGTPTTAGDYIFTVEVRDDSESLSLPEQIDTQELSIHIED